MPDLNGLNSAPYDDINAPIYIITYPELQVIYTNLPAAKLSGYPKQGKISFLDLFQDSDKSFVQEMFHAGYEVGVFSAFKVKLRRKSGRKLTVDLAGKLLKNLDSKLIIMNVHDVTALQSLAEDLENQVATRTSSLISGAKMKTLGDMAGGIAHEINTPLAIIFSSAQNLKGLVEQNKFDKALMLKSISRISDHSLRIGKIVTGLLAFAREGENESFRKVKIDEIVQDIFHLVQERFKNNKIQLKLLQTAGDIEIECRKIQISQVILNLLSNSFDAALKTPDPWVEIKITFQDKMFEISVTDSGKGIPLEVQDKIFNPFFTTKDPGKDTGLGLSIAKSIVQAHKGEIQLDNTSPNTRFVIVLPQSQTERHE